MISPPPGLPAPRERIEQEQIPAPREERRVRFEDDLEAKNEPESKKEKETDDRGGKELVYRKIHDKLSDKTELYKLHLKHYHMSPAAFRHRT